MPRQPRIEFEGACYHVINRGNYRSNIFKSDGAKQALLKALGETAQKLDWKIHAWVIMTNHFHVALETPKGNLVEGMKLWQGTFATRFNRLRKEQGHIFQGRYKSLLVDSGSHLGALCHYIHLNPIRARVCRVDDLKSWPWSSLHWMLNPKLRPEWFSPVAALDHGGGWPDTTKGHRLYVDYLKWLSAASNAKRELFFDEMCKGWVLGSAQFKKGLLQDREELHDRNLRSGTALDEGNSLLWADSLSALLHKGGFELKDALDTPKSAPWKIVIAAAMKSKTTVTNRWLADHLNMGGHHEVSRRVNGWHRNPDQKLERLIGINTNYNA